MLSILWDTRGYFFWLLVISLGCFVLERLWPWRKQQRAFRRQFGQDLFWLVFNGHYLGVLLAYVAAWLIGRMNGLLGAWGLPPPDTIDLLASAPLWSQFAVFLVLRDLLEYGVHNLLHRVPWLWEFHKLHHSIQELDFLGNMRFHWMEVAVYKSLTYLPLVLLGVDDRVIFWIAIVSTVIGHLNHSNLPISWGPLGYVINSPRFHVWHHDVILRGTAGQNFGILFSGWDWLFGTAHWPRDREQPARLGFEGMEGFPQALVTRLVYPFLRRRGGAVRGAGQPSEDRRR